MTSSAIVRLEDEYDGLSHLGSLNRSTFRVSVNTWDGSDHGGDSLRVQRCFTIRYNLSALTLGFADIGTALPTIDIKITGLPLMTEPAEERGSIEPPISCAVHHSNTTRS
jgi:hypothetical protein